MTAIAQFTRFQNYAEEQGLGNLTVTALEQDSNGYLLLGTQGGLFRYDGTSFRQDAVGLPQDWVYQVTTDGAGRTWVVTNQNGLFVGNGIRFNKVDIGKAPGKPSPHSFVLTGDGVVLDVDGTMLHALVGPRGVGPFHPFFDASTLATVPALGQTRFVVSDGLGGLLIGCGQALCRAAEGRVTVLGTADGLPNDAWQVALRTADGTLWVRSLSRLAWRRPGQATFATVTVPAQRVGTYFASQSEAFALLADRAGGVLTQGDNGLLDWNGTAWRPYAPHAGGLPAAPILAMLRDRAGSLWVGSEGYGAYRDIGLGVLEHWTQEDGLPSSIVWRMTRLPSGRFWVATDAGSVALGGGATPVPGENLVTTGTRMGRLWLAPTSGPLLRINSDGQTEAHMPSLGPVLEAVVDHQNRLWLTTRTGLFMVPNADASGADLTAQLALSGRWCQVAIDPGDTIWAICRHGAFRRLPNGRFEQVISAALLRDNVQEASFTANGELWMGTRTSGVLRFRMIGDRVEPLPPFSAPALRSNAVIFLHQDRRGWMWIGTDHGIDRYDGRSWRHFDSSDGLISNDMDQYSVFEDADGSMWFGTSHGLSHLIDPGHVALLASLHPLITGLSMGSRVLPLAPSVHIPWNADPLVVRFVDLDYARSRSIVFRYRLLGVDAGWSDTAAHEVRYPKVPAGKLRFELMAVDTVHGMPSAPIGFTIRISPPWWRRWWFYGLCVTSGGAVVLAAWQTRVRLLLQQRRHLEDVVRSRTAEIQQGKDQLQRQAEVLQRLAMSDALTGLANRHAIMSTLEAMRSTAAVGQFAVLLCDIDHFKVINDTFGHLAGDEVLAAFGSRLGSAVSVPEMAGRYGGEEFLLILHGNRSEILDRVATLRAAIGGTPFRVNETDRTVTCSGGIAFLRESDTVVSLLGRADAALYHAKANGRNRIEEERDEAFEMDQPEDPAATLKRDLRTALDRDEFELHYQPVLDVARNRIVAYEALLRWHSASRGDVSPGAFIPFAEQNDLMTEIDAWVIRTACRDAARWPDDIRVSVNLSPSHFHQPDLVQNIVAALAEAELPARRLELEVTETAMVVDVDTASVVLGQLRALGISVALDDFGTGYSSLSFLRTLPFDRIKIDRSFVNDLGSRPEAAAIIGSVIHLCTSMGTSVTAEGVETPEQVEMLRKVGCHELQGYEIGRPARMSHFQTGRHTAVIRRDLVTHDDSGIISTP